MACCVDGCLIVAVLTVASCMRSSPSSPSTTCAWYINLDTSKPRSKPWSSEGGFRGSKNAYCCSSRPKNTHNTNSPNAQNASASTLRPPLKHRAPQYAQPVVRSIRTLGILLHRHRGRLPRSTPRAASAAAKRALHATAALHHAARSPWFKPCRSGPPLACSSSRCRLCGRDAYSRTRICDLDRRAPASRPEDCSLLQTCAACCVCAHHATTRCSGVGPRRALRADAAGTGLPDWAVLLLISMAPAVELRGGVPVRRG